MPISDRLDWLNLVLEQEKKNNNLSEKAFIFKIDNEFLIGDVIPISNFINHNALSIYYEELKHSCDTNLMPEIQFKSGLITEEVYAITKEKQMEVLKLDENDSEMISIIPIIIRGDGNNDLDF